MKVLDFLKQVAANAKLIQILEEAEAGQKESVPGATTVVSLSQLIASQGEKIDDPENAPELNVPVSKVYEALKIAPPPGGWDVDKVIQALEAASIKDLGSDKARKALKDILIKNNVAIPEIIKNAISRDKALDDYERFVYGKLQERAASRERQIESLKQQIEDCNKSIEQLESSQRRDQELFAEWIAKKTGTEEELLKVVGLLTSGSLISVGQVTPGNKNKK
ncbi:MAG: hypothetical protein WCJ71_03625 [Candidatus Omnitrophota bacterium]